MRDTLQKMDADTDRLLTEAQARKIIDTVRGHCNQNGHLVVDVTSWWGSSQRWARNRASMTSDQRNIDIRISRNAGRSARTGGWCTLNQFDVTSIKAACDLVEYYVKRAAKPDITDLVVSIPSWIAKGRSVWSETTYNRTAEENGRVVHALTQRSAAQGLFSAGFIQTMAANVVGYRRDEHGRETTKVGRVTEAQCSATVRHPKATGSGWAGASSFDLARLDMAYLGDHAFEKCMKSLDPVRIEPGRYQTILEPQAVATLAGIFVGSMSMRAIDEAGQGIWYLDYDASYDRRLTKLGLKVVDDRVNIHHDPTDPIVGTHPAEGIDRIDLIKGGVLTTLNYTDEYAIKELYATTMATQRNSFQFDGGSTSIDDMIATTKRGLLVTRLISDAMLDPMSLLYTGVTRDGVWLVENGKITKSVRNFRWTESPLFVFNNIDQLGPAVPVFSPVNTRNPFHNGFGLGGFQNSLQTFVVPTLKVNDFSFTSTIDAV